MSTRRTVKARLYDPIFRWRNEHPGAQRVLHSINRVLRVSPPVRFRGWGMTTTHAPPWETGEREAQFRSSLQLAHALEFTGEAGISRATVDTLAWRHWFVTFAARHAVAACRASDDILHAAEFGVADGTTAFFALRELTHALPGDRVRFHLFDAWGAMRADDLLPGEAIQGGRYANLSLEATRRNLSPFDALLTWHPGYVPASLEEPGALPSSLSYVHIDLNAARPTYEVCRRVWPILAAGGVVLFDDYGWAGFEDTKRVVDGFALEVGALVLTAPTAQAMLIKTR